MTTYWQPSEPGRWLFHCHILTHVSPETMMLRRGMPMVGASMVHDGPMQDMAGLVMGITIVPGTGEPKHPKTTKARRSLTLLIADQKGRDHLSGYALSERGKPTTAVSAPGPPLVLT